MKALDIELQVNHFMTPLPNGLEFSLNYLPIAKNPSFLTSISYIEPFFHVSQPNKQKKQKTILVSYKFPNTLRLNFKDIYFFSFYREIPLWIQEG